MLRSLQVRNYVLIDSLDVTFPEGLIIITGQTGAGKSILLGALSLVLGAKADASVVGAAGDSCVVEAVFSVPAADAVLREILRENEADAEGDELIVRRVVNRTGRSRSFLNDAPVTLPVLASIATHLVDIHSQHQTLRLADPAFQLGVLDLYAGDSEALSACRTAWKTLRELESEAKDLEERIRRSEAERDYNQAQFDRLEAASLQAGELEELEAEQQRLAHAEEVREAFSAAENALSPQDESLPPVDVSLKEAVRSLERVSKFVPEALDLARRLDSARLEVDDIAASVGDLGAATEVSPQRLVQVEERLSLLYTLLKKHNCQTVADLIAVRDALSEVLYDADSLESRRAALQKRIDTVAKEHEGLCRRLSEARRKAAPAFSSSIQETLRHLELDRCRFEASVQPAPAGPAGNDAVAFRFSAGGEDPRDIAKVASGGELSRIMLSLKQMMARFTEMPTLVFDEIDTGVSGSVADKMGGMICDMSADMQVFAITHLPQVAAKGKAHYVVEKTYDGQGRPVSAMRRLEGEERVLEVARMLSGSRITEAAIENAKVLLGE